MATRISISILALILFALAGPGIPTPASAQDTVSDCTAFATFAEANDYYAQHPEAASLLDDDGDGTACEVYFGRESRNGESRRRDGAAESDTPAGDARSAQDPAAGLDCEDFATQEEAQVVYDGDPSDPNNLDPNGDGIACALLPSGVATLAQTDQAPAGNEDPQAKQKKRKKNRDAATEQVTVVTCDNYATQEEAQAAFDQDPAGLAALDSDQDGVACEELVPATPPTDRAERRRDRRQAETAQPEVATTEVVVQEPVAAPGPEDIDCIDFEFQEDAQVVYESDRSDPYNLDPNGDGFACSSLPVRNPVIVAVPRTGSGGTMPSRLPGAVALIALLAAALAAGTHGRPTEGISSTRR